MSVGTIARGSCSGGERLDSTPLAAWAIGNLAKEQGGDSWMENDFRGNITGK